MKVNSSKKYQSCVLEREKLIKKYKILLKNVESCKSKFKEGQDNDNLINEVAALELECEDILVNMKNLKTKIEQIKKNTEI